jgi:hypothetical protein
MRAVAVALAFAFAPAHAVGDDRDEGRRARVGMSATLRDVVLPGSLLEVRPPELATPIVLRIAASWPHGTALRYDLVWSGFEPGRFDLTDYLRRVDGTPCDDLPKIEVEVTSSLPPELTHPSDPGVGTVRGVGGYTHLAIGVAVIWIAALVALIATRRRGDTYGDGESAAAPATPEQRLRALVAEAQRGPLTPRRRAELELALIDHWRRHLDLGERPPAEAFALLKRDSAAGACIAALEAWLHAPGPKEAIDVAALLAPPRDEAPP